MNRPEWSERGDDPTALEIALVESAETGRVDTGGDRWLTIAKRIGWPALCAVLDEFAGEQIKVPYRASLLRPLWSRHLRSELERLLATGLSMREVAREAGASEWAVRRAAGYTRPRKARCVHGGRRTRTGPVNEPG